MIDSHQTHPHTSSVVVITHTDRLLFRKEEMLEECEEDRVQSTLLEFGHKAYRTMQLKKDAKSDKHKLVESAISGSSKDLSADAKAQEDRKFARMMKSMEQTGTGLS